MRLVSIATASLALAIVLLTPSTASAGVEACGDIHIEAGAECELVPPGATCDVQCTPISVQAACAGQLYVECQGECNATATVECTGSCTTSCEGECNADPGSFDCRASCQGSCEANCAAACSDDECMASCAATCSGSCDADCEAVAPSASCEAKCEASCDGSCTGEANIDCQVGCQSDGYLECTTEVQGSCMAACETEEGALFCDGAYVDHGGNLEECVEALMNLFNIEVEGYAEAMCEGNSCTAEAGGSVGCQMAGSGGAAASGWALMALGMLLWRRRRGQ